MRVTATTVDFSSWAAGGPNEKQALRLNKTHAEQTWTKKNLYLIVFNYIYALRNLSAYYKGFQGATYGDVLRCRLRRHQTA